VAEASRVRSAPAQKEPSSVAAGAVASSSQEEPNMTCRHFMQRYLSEKGLEVIGWN
jgi:hypothetical protein